MADGGLSQMQSNEHSTSLYDLTAGKEDRAPPSSRARIPLKPPFKQHPSFKPANDY